MVTARSEWSGQCFIETVAYMGPDASDKQWTAKTVGSANGFTKPRKKGRGAGSLFDMSTRCCLANSAYLTAETLENVPWHVAGRLWTIIKKNQLDSVQVWQAFAATYPEAPQEHGLSYRLKYIRKPQASLLDYLNPIRSMESSWLTILTLQDMNVTRGQAVHGIASLVNIEVLSFGPGLRLMLHEGSPDYTIGIDDAVIEAWSRNLLDPPEHSLESFRALKILNFADQADVTEVCRYDCERFPALQLITFINCEAVDPDKPEDDECWELMKISHTSWATWLEKNPESTIFTGWDNFVFAGLKFVNANRSNFDENSEGMMDTSRPRLHLLLGEDRIYEWNHRLAMVTYKRKPFCSDSEHENLDEQAAESTKSAPEQQLLPPKKNKKAIDIGDTLAQFLT